MRTHERVLASIEADLHAGRWALGEHLPAERALAEELGVSRPSVREAIRVLEAMGIVRTSVGSGPDAGARVVDRPAAALGAAVRLHVASGTLPVGDVVGTRVLVEAWAAEAAAGVEGDAHLAEAHDLLDRAEEDVDVETFLDLDQAFHLELVRRAGNGLVEAIMSGLRGAVQEYVAQGVERLPSWEDTRDRLRAEHRDLLAAVEAGDGPRAAAVARAHIEGFYREAGLGGADVA